MRWVNGLSTTISIKDELSKEELIDRIEYYDTQFSMCEEEMTYFQALNILNRIGELKQELERR